jgi:hypothetical protein
MATEEAGCAGYETSPEVVEWFDGWHYGTDWSTGLPRIKSDALSATARTGAWVLPEGMRGKIEASTTRKPSTP